MTGRPAAEEEISEEEGTGPSILFVLPWYPTAAGGVNHVVSGLIDGFAKAGKYRPLLLVNSYPHRRIVRRGKFYEYFVPPPFDPARVVRSLLSYIARLPAALWRLTAFLKRNHVAIVDLHYPGLSAFTVLVARLLSLRAFRVVLSFHGADVPHPHGLLQRLIWRVILRSSDSVVACSNALAEELRKAHPAVAVEVVHNAIDSAACRSKAIKSALPAGLERRRYVLDVGTFEHKKAHDILLSSFELLAADDPNLYLAIVGGSGSTFDACQALAAASASAGRILLYRDVPHGSTLAAIAHAQVLVLPSRREPFGIVILEAGAMGTPVVASRVGGIPEIIQDNYSGVLVAPGDVQGLSEALRRVLAQPQLSRLQATRLQRTVNLRFSLAGQVRAYENLFAEGDRPRVGEDEHAL